MSRFERSEDSESVGSLADFIVSDTEVVECSDSEQGNQNSEEEEFWDSHSDTDEEEAGTDPYRIYKISGDRPGSGNSPSDTWTATMPLSCWRKSVIPKTCLTRAHPIRRRRRRCGLRIFRPAREIIPGFGRLKARAKTFCRPASSCTVRVHCPRGSYR